MAMVIFGAESAFGIPRWKQLMQLGGASRLGHSICLTFVKPALRARRSKVCFAQNMAPGQEAAQSKTKRVSLTWRGDTNLPFSFEK